MGNPFVHIELTADDLGAAKKFYEAVFDWKLTDLKGTDYAMLDVGHGTGGGMTEKQIPQQRTAWLPYVEVADVKKTLAKAKKAGARVMLERTSLGDMGAIGVFVDPQGAPLGVWELAKKPAKKSGAKKAKTAKKSTKR